MIHLDGRPIQEKPLVTDTMDTLFDDFQNLVIDPSVWGQFVSGTGDVTTITDNAKGSRCCAMRTGATTGSRVNIYGVDDWQNRPGDSGGEITGYDNTSAMAYLVMEFEALFKNRANMNNADVILGLVPDQTYDRSSDDVCGFILNGDELAVLTDLGGSETVTAVPGTPDIETQLNHYRIYCMQEKIVFLFNHSVVAIHTTDLANEPAYPIFLAENDTDADSGIYITNVSMGYRRYPEQNLVV